MSFNMEGKILYNKEVAVEVVKVHGFFGFSLQ